mmetsp:Transcript_41076/g.97315  ORF Transcript_41076/g.97315 Transcript_41076/m.97315 type:complete len:212 (+) Transcript_41076:3-638(+)
MASSGYNGELPAEQAHAPQRSWSIQEENDWLRAVLRLAEAHIKHEKEELKSLNVVFERNKQDSEQRYLALEARMRATEKDKQEFDLRIYREREQIRSLENALNDIRARSNRTQELVQKAYTDEQQFLDHVRKLKASFTSDRARLEMEVQRVRQSLMQERTMREDAVGRETATLQRYRQTESQQSRYMPMTMSQTQGMAGQPQMRTSENLYM